MCDTLQEAIDVAKKSAKRGDVVLFSPASASFDMFKDFADRGRKFKKDGKRFITKNDLPHKIIIRHEHIYNISTVYVPCLFYFRRFLNMNESYEEYIRSILGYPRADYFNSNETIDQCQNCNDMNYYSNIGNTNFDSKFNDFL